MDTIDESLLPPPSDIPPEVLPRPRRVIPVRLADGAICLVRQHGNPAGPRLVLGHGNGMACDAFLPFWAPLLDDFEVVLADLRNHGWNPVGDIRRHTLPAFVWDIEVVARAVARELGGKPTCGVFHSVSALAALHHALRAGPRYDALVLFEPPFAPPLGHELESLYYERQRAITGWAATRQERFRSYGQLAGTLRAAPAFSRLVDPAFDLYARATLRPDDGGYVLRCPREHEAAVFGAVQDSTIALAMPGFPVPAKIVSGDPALPGAPTPTVVCNALVPGWDVDFESLAGASHFPQLEVPEASVEVLRRFVASAGLGG